MKIRFYLLVVFALIVSFSAFAGIGQWKSITNKSAIEDIFIDGDLLICATNGGVIVLDKNSKEILASVTNTEGLSNNHPVKIVVDKNHNWWLGMANGDLNKFDQESQTWQVYSDFSRFTIHDMVLKGDSLFVALDIGLSVFLLDKNEAKETYKNLGTIPVEVDVFTSFIQFPFIWVGTDFGLAYADLNQINLKAPQSWQNISTSDGLGSNKIKAIHHFGDSFFMASETGIQRYRNEIWTDYPNLSSGVNPQFFSTENELYLSFYKYVYKFNGDSDTWSRLVTSQYVISSIFAESNSGIWIGTEQNGIFKWNSSSKELEAVVFDGPSGNSFIDLAFDNNGNLWCASGDLRGRGIYKFDGLQWTNYTMENQDIPSNRSISIGIDNADQVWVGSHGKGVFRFSSDGNMIDVFNAQNGFLAGIPNDVNYSVVWDVAVDQTGTVWLANYQAHNGNNLVAVTEDSQWVYFNTGDGILPAAPRHIVVDQFNRKWVGTEGGGVYVYDDNFTPADKTDDSFDGVLNQSDGLEGNTITALAVDEFNTIWIGTNNGLNYYQDGRVFTKYGLITNDINCIEVDPVGNKWIGSSTGFSILDRDDLTFRHYTLDNSPLVNANVLSIAFDKKSGTAYLGTLNGLSVFETLFVEPRESLDQLLVYPNPFFITGTSSVPRLIVDQLCRDCDVNIYTASGFLVRKLVKNSIGGRAVWDGRNDEGNLVASGVYLVVAAQTDGVSKSAKVAVIQK